MAAIDGFAAVTESAQTAPELPDFAAIRADMSGANMTYEECVAQVERFRQASEKVGRMGEWAVGVVDAD